MRTPEPQPVRRTRYLPEDVGQYIRLSYWGTWDRVIAVRDDGRWVAVVGLTPINGDWDYEGKVGQPRYHCTSPEGDLAVAALPEKVEETVRAHGLGWVLDARPGDLARRFLKNGVSDRVLEEMLRGAIS
jgi:hypothetical protein